MAPNSPNPNSTHHTPTRRGGGNSYRKYRDRNSNTPSPKLRKGNINGTQSRVSPRTTMDIENNNRRVKSSSPFIVTPRQSPQPSDPNSNNESPYAGAKFSDPPSPKFLPRPPTRWVEESVKNRRVSTTAIITPRSITPEAECDIMTSQLKMMLKVTA
uniref:Proline-rich nuclear receptor coactivator 2-like n=1 Tax=Saccoglossus kowalevskii TaxID=10224 RepID=A0ABM0M9Q3_SACKO|nr:PREDICTED: proline-rich nuclear receptor coactivator 2-like [Saccoglossus kowalevskii]